MSFISPSFSLLLRNTEKKGVRFFWMAWQIAVKPTVSIKTEGLIGDKFIAIDPGGGGGLLANGDTITDTNSPTDIMDLISKYAFGDVK